MWDDIARLLGATAVAGGTSAAGQSLPVDAPPPPPKPPATSYAPAPQPKPDILDSLTPEQWLWMLENHPYLFKPPEDEEQV